MALVRAGSLAKLPPGSVMEVHISDRDYAVCNSAGVVRALQGICPHAGGPLGQGALHDGFLVCPWHAWEFNCLTGENDFDPGIAVSIFPVQIDGDDILIDIPASA